MLTKTSIFKTIFTLSFFAFTNPVFCQLWLQEDQQWTYEVHGGWNPNDWGTHTLKIMGDTLINGQLAKQFWHHRPNGELAYKRFSYEKNDSVFAIRSISEDWELIYDFTMVAGDTLTMALNSYEVLETGTTTIDSEVLRYQIVRFIPSNFFPDALLIVEGLGLVGNDEVNAENTCSYFLINEYFCFAAVDGWDIFFRCFNGDLSYDPYDFCAVNTEENLESSMWQIFPNPVSNHLFFQYKTSLPNLKEWKIFNALGAIMVEATTLPESIDVSEYPTGLYHIILTFENGTNTVQKVIVE